MTFKIPLWIKKRAGSGETGFLRDLTRSLKRQRDIPVHQLLREALITVVSALIGKFNLRKCDRVGAQPHTYHKPYVKNMGAIYIGDDVSICSRNVRADLITGPKGVLNIGNNVSINTGVSIVAGKGVTIGDRVRVGPYTMICDSSYNIHDDRPQTDEGNPIVIEDDVRLAAKVTVLKGSRIGKRSMVTAGSIVSGIVPPYVLVGGTPAKILKYLDPPRESGFHWEHNQQQPVIKSDTSLRVRKVAADIFSTDIDSIKDEYSHTSFSNWSSLQHVKFIHALEREFNIRLEREDWTRMSSIDRIIRVIQQYEDGKAKRHQLARIDK